MNKRILALILMGAMVAPLSAGKTTEETNEAPVVTPADGDGERGFVKTWGYDKPVNLALWTKGKTWDGNSKLVSVPAVIVSAVAAHFAYLGYDGKWTDVADVLKACVTPWKKASLATFKAHPYITGEVVVAIGSVVVSAGFKGFNWYSNRK